MLQFEEIPNDGPARVGVHSPEGFGKTFLASFFPKPVWIAPENGFPRDLPIRPQVIKGIREWPDVLNAVDQLGRVEHDRETLVFDTMDWLEPLIHRYVCDRDSGRQTEMNKSGLALVSIEDYGYGKGYIAAEEEMRRLIGVLDEMQFRRRIHVVMLMHSTIRKFENPAGPNFDRYEPKMHKLCSAVCKEWVENLLFGYYEVAVGKLDKEEKKAKGVSTGKRLLGTRNNSAYDAKNRVQLPDVVELNDPGVVVPYLLGEIPVESPYKLGGDDGAKPKAAKKTEPKTEAAKTEPKPDEPKAAHHPDRVDDEERRKNEALDKAAGRAPKSDDASKTEARTWTEPKKSAKPPKDEPKGKPSKAEDDAINDRIRRLTDVITRAGDEKGDAYRTKVEKWVKLAEGDPDKIEAIIEDVEKTLGPKKAA